MAPFVLLAPLIGPLLDRFRHGRRWALGTTLATRAFLAWVLATAVVEDSPWLFPAALGCLVASRTYAVARAAAVPRLLPRDISLVTANSRLTIAGLIGMAIGGGLAGALSQIGPDWSLRLAFVVYVAATVLAIRLPARVDSTAGELDLDGTPAGEGPLALPSAGRGARRLRALPPAVRYVLWLTTGARLLSGFLTLFLAFLMREHPLPGWSGPAVLAMVAGAAGVGNALGSVIGNRRHSPAPERLATVVAGVAVVAALLTAVLYSLPTLVLLGLATGLFGQLAKLSLDALIQRDVDDSRARPGVLVVGDDPAGLLGRRRRDRHHPPPAARARVRHRHRRRRAGLPRGAALATGPVTPEGRDLHTPGGILYAQPTLTLDPPWRFPVCSPATCFSCGKTTWSGCGMHADAVLARVPVEARCSCHDEAPQSTTTTNAFGW